MGYYVDYKKMQDYINQVKSWINTMLSLFEKVYQGWDVLYRSEGMRGEAADSIKVYISEGHMPVVKAICVLLEEYYDKISAYINDYYENVDSSPEAILSEEVLTWCVEKLEADMHSLEQMHWEMKMVLDRVRHICDVSVPGIVQLEEVNYDMVQKIKQIDENIVALERKHRREFEDLGESCFYIEKMLSRISADKKDIISYKKGSIKNSVEYTQLEKIHRKKREICENEKEHARAVTRVSEKIQCIDKAAVNGIIEGSVWLLDHVEQEEKETIPIIPEEDAEEIVGNPTISEIEVGNISELSSEAMQLLRALELADYQLADIAVYDDNGELIGMMPYYVMTGSSAPFRSDGGITIGYGHHINIDEWNDSDDRDHILLAQYIPEEMEVTYITADYETMTRSGLIVVSGAEMVPIGVIEELFMQDIEEQCRKIKEYLDSMGIEVSQNEFDALVIYRYNRGHLSDTVMRYLEEGNRNEEDWLAVWTGGDNRKEACQRLFFREEP